MHIKKTDVYKIELMQILDYIARDNVSAMSHFRRELNSQIQSLKIFPHKNRKSYYFDNNDIRDMIFNGYTIVYKIFEEKIEIMSIFNQNKPSHHFKNISLHIS